MDEGLPFTPKQLEEVINHLVEMMAQSHIRCLPDRELQKLAPGFDRKSPELIQADFDPMDGWSVETMSNDLGWSAEKMKNAWSAEKMNTIWSIYYDIFHSDRIFGANLVCEAANSMVKALVDSMVKRDRLPSHDSLEAQHVLRNAWDIVDVCSFNAERYKLLAKVSFVFRLFLVTLIVALSVFAEEIDELVCEESVDTCASCTGVVSATSGIFATGALLMVLTGMSAFLNPAQRWRELRAAAESLQSDIFQFRTRTGPFAMTMSDKRLPEAELFERVTKARDDVVAMAGLKESSFTQKYPDKVWKHGQNSSSAKGSSGGPTEPEEQVDNHHSPMKPSQFISARIVPMLNYYQGRVPEKYREWKVTIFLLLAATAGITLLSYLSGRTCTVNLIHAACIIASVAGNLTAWQKDSMADRKINRYTNAIVALQNHQLWWDSLSSVDQNSLSNINRLVGVTEDIKMVSTPDLSLTLCIALFTSMRCLRLK